jgi:DNA-binding winged helix-turn-helix (wHTH) protein/TolB-like protein/Tfp pilus assembly protein PilF
MASYPDQFYRFSVFAYDPKTAELLRNGQRVRLPEQSACLLTLLLKNAGELVTRQQIRDSLWPDHTFLDYDHAINKAVSQLRAVLRATRKAPSAIETIPKRGYRFVLDIQKPAVSSIIPPPTSLDEEPPLLETTVLVPDVVIPQNSGETNQDRHRPHWHRFVLGGVIAIVILVIVAGILFYQKRTVLPIADNAGSITVGIAPFDAEGTDAERIADSFRMELTDSLSRLPSIQVRAAHSFLSNKQDDANIRALSRMLSLDYIIFGKFTLNGSRCWLQLELVHGSDTIHLASLQYSGNMNQLSRMREAAEHDIFIHLRVHETPGLTSHGNTTNSDAYQHYLQGRYLLTQRTDSTLREAIEEFQAAVANDPNYAKAYAGMANAHIALAEHHNASLEENFYAARSFVQKALSIDPQLAEAKALQGYITFRYDWNIPAAKQQLQEAISAESSAAPFHIWYAIVLAHNDEFNEAFHQLDLAQTIDPYWPAVYFTDAFVANAAQDHSRALQSAHRLQELMPDWPQVLDTLAWAYWGTGQYEDAIRTWRKMAVLEKDKYREQLEIKGLNVFRAGGVPAYARLHLNAIGHEKLHQNDFSPEEWYAYAGEKQRALQALRYTVDHHSLDAIDIAINPAFTSLYNDLAFQNLVKRVGVPAPVMPAVQRN